jgi:hypothetical protein
MKTMKTKFVKVRDHWTLIHFLLLQFEEVDKETGFPSGLKIAVRCDGRGVRCFGGYDLRDKFGGTIQNLSQPIDDNGTTVAFKEILHYVDSIRLLPDEIDVENWRGEFFGLRGDHHFMPPEVRNILAEYPERNLRKVAYRKLHYLMPALAPTLHLAVIDVQGKEILLDIGSSPELLEFHRAQFLWIPLEIATEDELKEFNLGPLAKDLFHSLEKPVRAE